MDRAAISCVDMYLCAMKTTTDVRESKEGLGVRENATCVASAGVCLLACVGNETKFDEKKWRHGDLMYYLLRESL